MHEVVPQSQFFLDQLVTAPAGPTARPKTTNPEEPELPPIQPPGDLPEPDLPPPTPPTNGPEIPGTGIPGRVIPRIPPMPLLPPDDTPEIPFAPEQPQEPGNGPEAGLPVEPEEEVDSQRQGQGRNNDVKEQGLKTSPPVAPTIVNEKPKIKNLTLHGRDLDVPAFGAKYPPPVAPTIANQKSKIKNPTLHGRDLDVPAFGAKYSPPVAPTIANPKTEIKNPMPLFGWTWLDVAFVVIMPLLLLVGLFARRRRRMTT